jgi:hypothetical protein
MDNQISLGVRIADTKPTKFSEVDTSTWLKYMMQAEDLIERGYIKDGTSKRDLAEKLWKANA